MNARLLSGNQTLSPTFLSQIASVSGKCLSGHLKITCGLKDSDASKAITGVRTCTLQL